jgi:hypothetical protein
VSAYVLPERRTDRSPIPRFERRKKDPSVKGSLQRMVSVRAYLNLKKELTGWMAGWMERQVNQQAIQSIQIEVSHQIGLCTNKITR